MKHAIGPRREMGIRTIFNMLGPLTNPASVKKQVIGVFSAVLCEPLAHVLHRLGSEHVLVVHADDGLDELSIAQPATVAELNKGAVTVSRFDPRSVGLVHDSLQDLVVTSAEESLALIREALGKKASARGQKARDMIALNAGAAIYAADLADTLEQGVSQAFDAIGSGLALAKMEELASFSRIFLSE